MRLEIEKRRGYMRPAAAFSIKCPWSYSWSDTQDGWISVQHCLHCKYNEVIHIYQDEQFVKCSFKEGEK